MSDDKDPRVLFAAERTSLAWTRTSLSLIAFGFVVERSGLLLEAFREFPLSLEGVADAASATIYSFWFGIAFIVFGVISAITSALLYRASIKGVEDRNIPTGYFKSAPLLMNVALAILGSVLALCLVLAH